MLRLGEPSDAQVRRTLAVQAQLGPSYADVGASRTGAPPGYPINHYRHRLGFGPDVFARSVEAVRTWRMYALHWTRLVGATVPPEVGTTVGVVARHFGLWSLNACRVVYLLDEKDGVVRRRYGFAIGTLPAHMERGEERFTVEWHRSDDAVWYELFAFAAPRHALARLGFPLTRRVQRRFAVDSARAVRAASWAPQEHLGDNVSDERDARGLPKPRLQFTNGENERHFLARPESLMDGSADPSVEPSLVGGSTVEAVLGNRVAPTFLDHYMASHAYDQQHTDGPHVDRPNNLWAPVPGNQAAHGRFDDQAQSHSLELELATTSRGALAIAAAGVAGLVLGALSVRSPARRKGGADGDHAARARRA